MAARVAEEAKTRGLDLIRLPSEEGNRFGIVAQDGSPEVVGLIEALTKAGDVVERQVKDLNNNLYEFDQVSVKSPDVAVWFKIQLGEHCRAGKRYLSGRTITLELLERQGDLAIIPRPGLGPRVYGSAEFTKLVIPPARAAAPIEVDWPFPIDLVYTWVDSDDPVWQKQRAQLSGNDVPESAPVSAINAARWHSRDELKFSMRSAWMYAPFIRKIYIVTNGQVPAWLTAESSLVEVVPHEKLYPDLADLPTFNSNHIETVLHRIPGLSEHFLYLNDDFFFGAPSKPSDFFTASGICRVFRSARFLDERPVVPDDRATVAAHKNTRDVIEGALGTRPTQKFRHAPYVMRRSVWDEIDARFDEELAATRKNRFRSFDDLNGQFLFCHYAMARGYAVPSSISYQYVEVLENDLAERLVELDKPRYKVFCINDSNSTEDDVDKNSELLREFFEARFPEPGPWEKSSTRYIADGVHGAVDLESRSSLESEVRRLGARAAKIKYRELTESTASPTAAKKLMRLAINEQDVEAALEAANVAVDGDENFTLTRLDIISKCGARTEECLELVPTSRLRAFVKALGYLGRTVEDRNDLAHYTELVGRAPAEWQRDVDVLTKLGAAARRAGSLDEAVAYLEEAIELALAKPAASGRRKREDEVLSDPWTVADDLLEISELLDVTVFADAGTLLGFIREGDFLKHDYDIDFSCRDANEFERLGAALREDWRFDVSRGRTPESLIQARHINGTLIDVFRHVRRGSGWIKESHVYGWRFDDFDLMKRDVNGRTLSVPSPPEKYLEQMYGAEWQVPIAGFDSRLYAPNCYFPNREEIICTILNKAVGSASRGDLAEVAKSMEFLQSRFGYSAPGTDRLGASELAG